MVAQAFLTRVLHRGSSLDSHRPVYMSREFSLILFANPGLAAGLSNRLSQKVGQPASGIPLNGDAIVWYISELSWLCPI